MKLDFTKETLQEVKNLHSPSVYVWLFSGGDDSLACGKACLEVLGKIDYAIFCDTGTCIPQTKQFVIDTCEQMGVPLLIGTTTEKDSYENYVQKFGFPGQNHKQHTVMYRMLKSHSLSRCISSIRKKRRGYKIALLTGARFDESTRRMGTVKKIDARGSDIWINPIQNWSKTDIYHYFKSREIKRSIVAETIGRSGECNCGVFGNPQELDEINLVSPEFVEWIRDLEKKVNQNGFAWKWGESPPKSWSLVSNGQMTIDGMACDWENQQLFMCSTCINNQPFKHTKRREKQLFEYKILQQSCEGKEDYVLMIGKMANIMTKLYSPEKKQQLIMKLIEEKIKTDKSKKNSNRIL